MKIAIVGCAHGALDRIYADIASIESKDGIKIDLVLICGDFQSVRNEHDLQCMAVPVKYREIGTFHRYYSGELKAPYLTIFVGGNHEASNYLQTLPFGGWVATNIYFMGYANVIQFGGLRIGGVSGIYQRNDAPLGHFERLPYNESTKRSAYHVRNLEIYRLLQLNKHDDPNRQLMDIFLSHDWPLNIHTCGDVNWLLKRKKHFYDDVMNSRLGNPLFEPLVGYLMPKYWFSAHLHVRFEACVRHNEQGNVQTKFLALDKAEGRRQYLEIIDIEPSNACDDRSLHYDPEWIAILKTSNDLLSIEKNPTNPVPSFWRRLHQVSDKDIKDITDLFESNFKIPENFQMSEPAINGRINDLDPERIRNFSNPQTTEFCSKLNLTDPIKTIIDSMKPLPNPDQISISDEDDDEEESNYASQQKKLKMEEANVEGDNLFFIDRKGDKRTMLIQNAVNTENPLSYDQGNDESHVQIIEEVQSNNTKATDSCESNSNTIQMNTSPSNTNEQTSDSTSKPLSKRARARRAKKLRQNLELKQLEEYDKAKDEYQTPLQKSKKAVNRIASNERRKFVLERLKWVKHNLPLKGDNEQIQVLSLDQFSSIQNV